MDSTSFNLTEFEQATGAERKHLAKTLDYNCRDSGFLLISGQQVPTRVIQAQWAAVSTFFTLSQEHKKKWRPPIQYTLMVGLDQIERRWQPLKAK